MMLRPGHVWGTAVFAILASVILVVVIIILCATGKSAAVQCVYCAVCVRTDHLLFGVYCAVTLLLFGVYCAVTLLLFGVHCAIAMSAVRCLLRNVSSYLLRRVLTPDAPHDPYTDTPTITFSTFGTAFGVILFGFGGHAILPALQATLAEPSPARFRQAIVLSFSVCTCMYLSTSISSVLRLGGTIGDDVLTNFSGAMNDFGLVSVTAHLLFAVTHSPTPLDTPAAPVATAICNSPHVAPRASHADSSI